jgi:hypothetical protein
MRNANTRQLQAAFVSVYAQVGWSGRVVMYFVTCV